MLYVKHSCLQQYLLEIYLNKHYELPFNINLPLNNTIHSCNVAQQCNGINKAGYHYITSISLHLYSVSVEYNLSVLYIQVYCCKILTCFTKNRSNWNIQTMPLMLKRHLISDFLFFMHRSLFLHCVARLRDEAQSDG